MDLVIRSFSFERQARIFNYSPTAPPPTPQAEADLGRSSTILGGFTEPSDPDLKNQYINETLLGYEREVLPDVAVGIKGIYRDYGEVIEDFLCADDGTYCIGNPGKGIMSRIFTLDYSQTLPGARGRARLQGRAARRPPSASRRTGRGSRPTSTRSSTATSTASTRRSPTSAPTRTSPPPTTTTTSSPTAAT